MEIFSTGKPSPSLQLKLSQSNPAGLPAPPRGGAKSITGAFLAFPFERRPPAGGRCRVATKRGQGVTEGDGEGAPAPLRGAAAAAAEGPSNRRSEKKVQRRRPPPAADTGRSCWGSGQQDTSAAQGTKWTLGTATRLSEAARFFPVRLPLWGLKGASSPFPVAGWVESRGREGGVGTPLPASGPAERPCTLKAGKNFPRGAERILNRPTPGGLHHKIRAFGNAVLRKIALLQRHPPGGKIRVACALPRL